MMIMVMVILWWWSCRYCGCGNYVVVVMGDTVWVVISVAHCENVFLSGGGADREEEADSSRCQCFDFQIHSDFRVQP